MKTTKILAKGMKQKWNTIKKRNDANFFWGKKPNTTPPPWNKWPQTKLLKPNYVKNYSP